MLGKTLILGLISAGAAGAIVYYGTGPQGSEALESHPHNDVVAEKSVENPRDRIAPRLPTIRKAGDDDGRKKLASKGWKTDGVDTETDVVDMPPIESALEDTEPKPQTRWLDQYLKKNTGEGETASEDGPDVEIVDAPKGGSSMAANSYTVTERDAIDDIEPEVMPDDMPKAAMKSVAKSVIDRRTFRIVDGKLVEVGAAADVDDVTDPDDMAQMEEAQETSEMVDEVNAKHEAEGKHAPESKKPLEHKFAHGLNDFANDSTPLLSTVMREAAQIKKSELRDQAYFEITEYALSEGRFDSARMAHDMIEQDELSYTAKSRIAVAFAQNGKPTKAFKVISEVDEAELRDFMRLQVIEALIAPERLPASWQEKTN